MTEKEETKVEDDNGLRDYELVLIINPEVADEAVEATVESVSKIVTESGGAISDVERWGKRKLAYPLKHFMEGNYVLARFKMDPVSGKQLEANLRISEDVLRHLLIRLDEV
jgi:small subunit ribosomal protein S6